MASPRKNKQVQNDQKKSNNSKNSNENSSLDNYKKKLDSLLSDNCTIKSVSSLKTTANFQIEENISDADECSETTKHLPIKRRNTLSHLPKTIFNLENLCNKKRRLIVSSRKPHAEIFSLALHSSLKNTKRSKTINSDLGVLPSVLTKNLFFPSKQTLQRPELNENLQIVGGDGYRRSFQEFSFDDLSDKNTNSLILPITSTPKKQHQRLLSFERLVQATSVEMIKISQKERSKSMKAPNACNRALNMRNNAGINPDGKGEKTKKLVKQKKKSGELKCSNSSNLHLLNSK